MSFENKYGKMAVDCSKARLTQLQWLLFCALVYTAEFAIGLLIATISLNQQLESVQLLISDAKHDQSPNHKSTVSPGCYCPPEESRSSNYRPNEEVDSTLQYLITEESTFSSIAREEQRHDRVNCCETDAKTLRKVSCSLTCFMMCIWQNRSSCTNKL